MHVPTMMALEFPRIQQELASYTSCQMGRELALKTEPLPTLTQIRRVQQEAREAKAVLTGGRSMPFGGIQDVRQQVERAAIGGVLRPDDLTAVADTIYGCRQLHRFLVQHRAEAPLLSRYAEAFGQFDEVEAEIRRCIERGGVSSQASRSLKQVRNEIATLESRIQERLNSLLKQFRNSLQESLVTTRNGRYVIPVKASARASVPGAVHGSSASGSTLFIEPEAISHLCAELESWRAMEEAEIEQVLMALSGRVAAHADGLQATLGAVAELDLIAARARLSHAWDARPVSWNEVGLIDLLGARHPLLGKQAVGNRIRMSAEARMLIVTGPNTGGKTLLLKTLGLLVIIARCGLHLPVEEGSTLCFFDDVFADIGDHQSLEQSLSTFSGHIANVAPMLARATPRTLILLDELGSGTDPHEGTGLGIALLEAFLQKGAYTLATTHLREIKEFGRNTPGCAYAGMGFDGETLRPTYRLIYGALGESRGLEIAARNGLPAAVVERARQLVYGSAALPPAPSPTPEPRPEPRPEPTPTAAPASSPEPLPAPAPATPARPSQEPLSLVLAAGSGSRLRVYHEGSARELSVREHVKRLFPAGLVVGDRVRVREGQVVEVAHRWSVLVDRDADTMQESVVAANITRLVIAIAARQPDFHAAVLARHLLYAERQGVTPIICLTRADMVPPNQAEEWLKPFRQAGYQTVSTTRKRQSLDELRQLLTGQVAAIMEAPGGGKAALLAALTGEDAAHGQAHLLSPDSWLIDLPGLRELGVWKPDLSGGFAEFGPFIGRCHRPGCLHTREPGCAVREAVERGSLQRRRYEQYLHLLRQMRLA
ncbi:MAG: endonuclease MutS2 [Bacillota bacterium]